MMYDYTELVKIVIREVINKDTPSIEQLNVDELTVIDDWISFHHM